MLVSPSILAADFCNLQRDVEMVNASVASMIHCDVMDGVFVPNISIGFPVIKAVSKVATKPLDVHLMLSNPQAYITRCRDLGVSIVNVHQEACVHLHRVIEEIRQAGMKPAVTVNPSTPVELLRDVITDVYMVLVMSVNPGFGGQQFIPNTINKVRRLRQMIDASGSQALIEVDGGINLATGAELAAAGANVLVAGSSIFKSSHPTWFIGKLSEL